MGAGLIMKMKDILLTDEELEGLQSMLLQDKDLYNKIANLNKRAKFLEQQNSELLEDVTETAEQAGMI